jgi:hypothetical protein
MNNAPVVREIGGLESGQTEDPKCDSVGLSSQSMVLSSSNLSPVNMIQL